MREQGLQHISDETEELALGHAYAACGFGPLEKIAGEETSAVAPGQVLCSSDLCLSW